MSEIPVTTIHITNTESKIELLKEWESRKGNEPWTLDDIAELIASAHSLAEERIIRLLENYGSEQCRIHGCNRLNPNEGWEGHNYECDTYLAEDLIALIKGENK